MEVGKCWEGEGKECIQHLTFVKEEMSSDLGGDFLQTNPVDGTSRHVVVLPMGNIPVLRSPSFAVP